MNLCAPESNFSVGECIRVENLPFGFKRILFTRSSVRNALSFIMIREIIDALDALSRIKNPWEMRGLVIAGEGTAFSAGADLHDMGEMVQSDAPQKHANSQLLAEMFFKLASFPAPTIAAVQGPAIAGATGLLACTDHVIASPDAKFALPEVRLGLVAATIAPYLIRRLGVGHSLSLMLTARKMNVEQAFNLGLVHEIAPTAGTSALENSLQSCLENIISGSPEAQRASKALTIQLSPLPSPTTIEYTAKALSAARESADAKEGLSAFFAHTTPAWSTEYWEACKNVSEDA
jgi:methylglutaconyl-CoA hydratase